MFHIATLCRVVLQHFIVKKNSKKITAPNALMSPKTVIPKCAIRGSNPGHPD